MEETMPTTMVPTDRSDQLSELVKALCDARPNFGRIEKGLEGEMKGVAKKSGNAYSFKFKYADLAAAVEATSLALAESGLNIFQSFEDQSERSVVIVTELWHASGQWMRTRLRMPCSFDPQSIGIASTYGRRYAYLAILGLAPEDVDGEKLGAARPPASSGPPSNWTPRADAKPAESAPRSEVKAKPKAIAQEGRSPKNPKFEAWEEYWAWVKMGYGTAASSGATISTDTAVDWLAGVAKDLGWLEGPVLRVIAVELGLRLEEVPLLTGDGEYLLQRIYFALKKFNPNEIMKRYDEAEAEKDGSVDPPAETLDAMSGALRSFAEIKWAADEEGEGEEKKLEEKKLELAAWEALQAALVVTVGMDLPKRSDESLAKLTDKGRNGGRDLGAVKDLVIRRLGGVEGGMILHDIPEYIVPTLLKVLATFPAAKLAGDIVGDQVGLDDLSMNDGAGEVNYAGSEG